MVPRPNKEMQLEPEIVTTVSCSVSWPMFHLSEGNTQVFLVSSDQKPASHCKSSLRSPPESTWKEQSEEAVASAQNAAQRPKSSSLLALCPEHSWQRSAAPDSPVCAEVGKPQHALKRHSISIKGSPAPLREQIRIQSVSIDLGKVWPAIKMRHSTHMPIVGNFAERGGEIIQTNFISESQPNSTLKFRVRDSSGSVCNNG